MKYSLTTTIIALIISAGLAIFLFIPQYQTYKKDKAILKGKKTEIANEDNYNQQLVKTWEQITNHQEIADRLNSAIPSHRDIPSFITFVKTLSKSNGDSLDKIKWDSIRVAERNWERNKEKSKEKEGFKTYSVMMSASGTYWGFKNLLFALENSARLVNVQKIHFTLGKSDNQFPSFEITMNIHSY